MDLDMCNQVNEWKAVTNRISIIVKYIFNNRQTLDYKEYSGNKSNIVSSLIYRMARNLRGVQLLASHSAENNGSVFFKLPVGILVRNCLMDCILGLHIVSLDEDRCRNLMALKNRNYVNALFEEFEVYRDKISTTFDEIDLEHMYTMALEDTYLGDLSINKDIQKIEPLKERFIWKPREYKEIYDGCKREDDTLKKMKDSLSNNPNYANIYNSLYAYYKYFSQYEHYSPRGDGDSLADFGNDNINFKKSV